MADINEVNGTISKIGDDYAEMPGGYIDVRDTEQGRNSGVRQMVTNPTVKTKDAVPNYAPTTTPPAGTGYILPSYSFENQLEFEQAINDFVKRGWTEAELTTAYVSKGYIGTTAITAQMIKDAIAKVK